MSRKTRPLSNRPGAQSGPIPDQSGRQPARMAQHSPQPLLRSLRRLRAAFWRRRVARWLVRAVWLALLVPTAFMVDYLGFGRQVHWQDWLYPMLLVGLLAVLWSIRPIRLKQIVRRLDSRLGLRARLITAFEVSEDPHAPADLDNPVVQRLLQETVQIVIDLRRQVRLLNRTLWLEMQALIAVAALLSALLILDALSPRIPNATPVELPPAWQEPSAEEVIPPEPKLFPPPFPPEMRARALSAEQLQAALQALAEALRDQATTHSIAEALDRGDLNGAAEGLRRLADQLDDLSDEAQSQLGNSLQEAAGNIGDNAPNLTQPLGAGSNALANGDLRGAGQALEDLAEALDSIAETPSQIARTEQNRGQPDPSGQQTGEGANGEAEQEQNQSGPQNEASGGGPGAGQGSGSSQPTEEERLAVEGQPMELESDPEPGERVLQPAELDAEAGDQVSENAPFTRRPVNAAAQDLGPDPLTYPWEKREVIRRYFTP